MFSRDEGMGSLNMADRLPVSGISQSVLQRGQEGCTPIQALARNQPVLPEITGRERCSKSIARLVRKQQIKAYMPFVQQSRFVGIVIGKVRREVG